MAARKSQHASITLVFYLALLVFASLADASSHLHLSNNHKRLLKKRAPQLLPDPIHPSRSLSLSPVDTSPSTTDTPTPTPAFTPLIISPSALSSQSTTSTSSSSSSSSSSPTASSATTARSATSTSGTTSSSTLASSSTTSTSITLPPSSAQTLTQTATFTSSSSVASAPPQAIGGSSDSKKTTTTVIIVIAASVGGIAILWTLFRKWKLRRSSRFDERLQPIDWQPPTEGEGRHQPTSTESGAAHNAHGSEHGHGTSSDLGHGGRLTPLPEHDFTPLPANPFAAAGTYTELAREHTIRPQMQEAYGAHNPVMTRPAYDVNVPLHHQAGYGGHDGYDYTQYHGTQMRY